MRFLLAAAALLLVVAAAAAAETTTFVLERLNGTYTDLGGTPREVDSGPITVRSTSSSNSFRLIGNRLALKPRGAGRHDAEFWVHFEGTADVEAEILMAGISAGTVQDEVVVPVQERTLEAVLEVERRPEDYLITLIDSPRDFQISIRSRLGGQIVSICENLTRWILGTGCDGLEASLSNPRLPMPEPGKQFVLEAAQLTPEERAQLDAYLAGGE